MEICDRLWVLRTLVENAVPQARGFGVIAPLLSKRGEVTKREVAIDSLIDATKLVETLDLENAPPRRLGFGGAAERTIEGGLAKEKLCIVGIETKTLGAGLKRSGEIAELLMSPGYKGE
jgi:hypothetical protein